MLLHHDSNHDNCDDYEVEILIRLPHILLHLKFSVLGGLYVYYLFIVLKTYTMHTGCLGVTLWAEGKSIVDWEEVEQQRNHYKVVHLRGNEDYFNFSNIMFGESTAD